MRNRRGIVIILLAVAFLTTGITVAAVMFFARLPDPAVADRDGLLRWLVARDLELESPTTCEVLACRLDEEFRSGIDWETTGQHLDDGQRTRVRKNVLLLTGPWLKQKLDRYLALPKTNRSAFLDEVIDSIHVWRGVDSLCPNPSADDTDATPAGGLLGMMLTRAKEFKAQADPARREQIDQFVQAVQTRWLMRSLSELYAPPTS